jgi:hypothetical protein
MSRFAKSKLNSIPPIPAGMYPTVICTVADVGTHYSEKYKKSSPKLILSFEIPSQTCVIDGQVKPRQISRTYTLSLTPKSSLRRDLEAMLNRKFSDKEAAEGFDLGKLIGLNATIQLGVETKDGNDYNTITTIACKTAGAKKLLPSNPITFFVDEDQIVPESLPKWIREMIEASKGWNQEPGDDDDHDAETALEDIPI